MVSRLVVWIGIKVELALERIGAGVQGGSTPGSGVRTPWSLKSEGGQTVAEYALVLLVAAAIAAAFLLWARQSGRLDAFFDLIFDRLLNSVDPNPTPTPAP